MLELLPQLEEWKRQGEYLPERARVTRGSNRNLLSTPPNGRVEVNTANPNQASASIDALQQEIKKRLSSALRTRTMRGFPLNVPFTDVDEILTKVKTVAIHENNHPEVQFILAVKAIPLFNNTLSLWIFVGTLETINPSKM